MLYVYFMYLNVEIIGEVKDIGLQSHDDILKWGRNYINFNFTAKKDNVITYEAFEDENEETPITQNGAQGESADATRAEFDNTTPEA